MEVQPRGNDGDLTYDPDFGALRLVINALPAEPRYAVDLSGAPDSEAPGGWSLSPMAEAPGAPGWSWTADGLRARGGGEEESTMEAVGPVRTAGGDMKVTVEFQILEDDEPYERFAFPRVNLRALDEGRWLGCYIRNDQSRLRAGEAPDALSPALNCVFQTQAGSSRTCFEGCRDQFYVDGTPGGGRYDWLSHHLDRHRLEVVVVGRQLQAQLYNLDQPPEGGGPVAMVRVPDIDVEGEAPSLGMAGLGAFDSGEVLFTRFTVEGATAADLTPGDGGCP